MGKSNCGCGKPNCAQTSCRSSNGHNSNKQRSSDANNSQIINLELVPVDAVASRDQSSVATASADPVTTSSAFVQPPLAGGLAARVPSAQHHLVSNQFTPEDVSNLLQGATEFAARSAVGSLLEPATNARKGRNGKQCGGGGGGSGGRISSSDKNHDNVYVKVKDNKINVNLSVIFATSSQRATGPSVPFSQTVVPISSSTATNTSGNTTTTTITPTTASAPASTVAALPLH